MVLVCLEALTEERETSDWTFGEAFVWTNRNYMKERPSQQLRFTIGAGMITQLTPQELLLCN